MRNDLLGCLATWAALLALVGFVVFSAVVEISKGVAWIRWAFG